MVLCSKCKKNMAVVFITKMENGKEVSEGLCFQCAKELGIKPFDKMLSQFGINEEDFMNMNEELTEMMEQGAMFVPPVISCMPRLIFVPIALPLPV